MKRYGVRLSHCSWGSDSWFPSSQSEWSQPWPISGAGATPSSSSSLAPSWPSARLNRLDKIDDSHPNHATTDEV